MGGVHAEEIPTHGRPFSLKLTLPPLAALFFKAASSDRSCGDGRLRPSRKGEAERPVAKVEGLRSLGDPLCPLW